MKKLEITMCMIGVVIMLGVFYTLVSMYPLVSDDFTYHFVFPECSRIVCDISDVFVSQKEHWHMCNGRFLAHFLVQTFLMFDIAYFNIANTICYAVCCGVMARFLSKDCFFRNWLFILISFWLLMPTPATTMFWVSGSLNYLWTSCLILVFLILLLSGNPKKEAAAIIVGLAAGNGHESMAFGVFAFLIVYAFVFPRKSPLFYAACVALAIGICSNVLAPATSSRLDSMSTGGVDDVFAFCWKYIRNVMKVGYRLFINWSDIGVQCCVALWLASFVVWLKSKDKREEKMLFLACLLVGALGSLIPNVASGVTYVRSVYGFCFLSYLSFAYILLTGKKVYELKVIGIIMLLVNILVVPKAYNDIRILKESMEKVYRECNVGKMLTSVIPECDDALPSRYAGSPVSASVRVPSNRCLASLLGVESISILRAADAAALERHHARIANASTHEMVDVDGYLGLVRLQGSPQKVTSSIKRSSHIKPGDSLLTKVKDWIARQQGLRGDFINVVRIGGGYYLFWERGIFNGTVQMEYAEGTSVTINVD